MSKPLYHHLLVILDWEIIANKLFLTHEEVEPALRKLVTNADDRLPLNEQESQEILAAKDWQGLCDELSERDITVYLTTIPAPQR